MEIKVFGKKDCGLCESAKNKLKLMELEFGSYDIEEFTSYHEGWRTDGSVEVQACYRDINTLPVLMLDGKAMGYPQAMKQLKKRAAPSTPEVHTIQPAFVEKACVGECALV